MGAWVSEMNDIEIWRRELVFEGISRQRNCKQPLVCRERIKPKALDGVQSATKSAAQRASRRARGSDGGARGPRNGKHFFNFFANPGPAAGAPARDMEHALRV